MASKIKGLEKLGRDLASLARLMSKKANRGLFKAGVLIMEAGKSSKYWTIQAVKSKKGPPIPTPEKPKPTQRTGNARRMIGPPKKVGLGRVVIPARAKYSKFLEEGGYLFMTPALEDNQDKINKMVGTTIFSAIKTDGWKVD